MRLASAESEGGDEAVVFSWARHRSDKEGDEYTITWAISSDGSLVLGPNYARSMELGWQAFALSLIQTEIDDEDRGANRRFLHDASNFNFVQNAQGGLSDVLEFWPEPGSNSVTQAAIPAGRCM